ncbi:uncharacterized protein V1516DRAFT_694750 [Lipomyces oligophaga]|uniref:uncharacterized protein n=1 Tax=Lipomyces oligophaga TaxID=45792 RepID=UPI0034CEEEE2
MAPQVLSRVLYGATSLPSTSTLKLTPATLAGYTRSSLSDESYPAIIASSEDSEVTGILVQNITWAQLVTLDKFEGDEYERKTVVVKLDGSNEVVEAQCYVWVDDIARLTGVDWDFSDFMKKRFSNWIEKEIQEM